MPCDSSYRNNKNNIKSMPYDFIFVENLFCSTQIYTHCFLLSPAVHVSMMIAGDLPSLSESLGYTS